jgi:putative hemolysin
VNASSTSTRKHPPLLDLAGIPNPVLQGLMPFAGAALQRWLKIDALNDVHDGVINTASPETFFSRTLEILGARYEVSESDLDRIPASGPVVVVSNHPLGGLDGIMLGDLLRRRRTDTRLMANFLLARVRHADAHMFFVDPFPRGPEAVKASMGGIRSTMKHLKNGGLLGVFPGNRVSHWQWDRREICDPDWVANIGGIIRRAQATVLPLFIEGGNSLLFNLAGIIHPLLRTIMLPRELIRQARDPNPVRIHVGTPIPFHRLKKFDTDEGLMSFLRVATYVMGNRPEDPTADEPILVTQAPAPIAAPLTAEKFEADIAALAPENCIVRQGDYEVYLARAPQLPHILREIGRGREVAFRAAGGGTLKPLDLAPQDDYYHHLFLWHKKDRAVVGAYRLGLSDEILAQHGPEGLICSSLFHLKPAFLAELSPGIELGRSYILPEYQRNYNSLLLLWSGILGFIARNPKYRYTFGSVGISQGDEYSPASRTLIVNYMKEHLSHPTLSVHVESRSPFEGIKLSGIKKEELSDLVQRVEDVSTLVTGLEEDGKGIPVLIKHYIRMNAKLLSFGILKDHSNAVVSFIVVDVATADPKSMKRFMGGDEPYQKFLAHHGLQEPKADAAPERG